MGWVTADEERHLQATGANMEVGEASAAFPSASASGPNLVRRLVTWRAVEDTNPPLLSVFSAQSRPGRGWTRTRTRRKYARPGHEAVLVLEAVASPPRHRVALLGREPSLSATFCT